MPCFLQLSQHVDWLLAKKWLQAAGRAAQSLARLRKSSYGRSTLPLHRFRGSGYAVPFHVVFSTSANTYAASSAGLSLNFHLGWYLLFCQLMKELHSTVHL